MAELNNKIVRSRLLERIVLRVDAPDYLNEEGPRAKPDGADEERTKDETVLTELTWEDAGSVSARFFPTGP